MKKGELRELYQMMFPEYPDIVTVKELREMLGISCKLAYKLIDYGYIPCKIEDFVGRGAAVKRMSFRTSAEANDMKLAATRAHQRSDTPW